MKLTLLVLLASLVLSQAGPIDSKATPREKQLVQLIYNRWTLRWGGIPKPEKTSIALYMMLAPSVGNAQGLTPIERALLNRLEQSIKSRVN